VRVEGTLDGLMYVGRPNHLLYLTQLEYKAVYRHFQDRHHHPSHQAAPAPAMTPATAPATAPAPAPAPATAPGPAMAPATAPDRLWQTAGPKKRGRPPGSTKAAKNTADIRSFTHRWLISGNTILGITGCEGLLKDTLVLISIVSCDPHHTTAC
jgi:uncharacterized membrane protein